MAALNSKLQGFKAQFSFTVGGGSAVQWKSLQDFELNIKGDVLDATDHDSAGWKSYMTGMLDWDGTIKGCYIDGDTSQGDILAALLAQTICVGVFEPVLNAGSQTYSGNFTVTGWKHGGATNNGIQTVDVTIKCAGPLTLVAHS